jgi:hypothetical protein
MFSAPLFSRRPLVRRTCGLLLAALLLTGCAATPTQAPPVPDPAAQASTPTQPDQSAAPGTDPAGAALADLRTYCSNNAGAAPDTLAGALAAALGDTPPDQLETRLQAIAAQAPCIRLNRAEPGASPVVLAAAMGGQASAIVWYDGAHWLGSPVAITGDALDLLDQVASPAGPILILEARMAGSGGFGALQAIRLENGQWRTLLRTELFDHFAAKVLGQEHILVTARQTPPDAPLAWGANCCIPTSHQWLYKLTGDGYTLAAERDAPDPYFTLSAFFGALRTGDAGWLERLATPDAIAKARAVRLNAVDLVTSTPTTEPDLGGVLAAELAHWPDQLPPAVDGPTPAVTKMKARVEVLNGLVKLVDLTLERQDDQWRITALATP